jgi:hypothetical protein
MKQALSLNSDEEGERETRLELATNCLGSMSAYLNTDRSASTLREPSRPLAIPGR